LTGEFTAALPQGINYPLNRVRLKTKSEVIVQAVGSPVGGSVEIAATPCQGWQYSKHQCLLEEEKKPSQGSRHLCLLYSPRGLERRLLKGSPPFIPRHWWLRGAQRVSFW
jgi:hypothetical protein